MVAVASRDGDRGRAWAAEHGIERAHGSYEALLEDPAVEAVYIPLPNALHVPWSLRALGAGKHVLCEKPLTRRAEDVEAAFDAAEARADPDGGVHVALPPGHGEGRARWCGRGDRPLRVVRAASRSRWTRRRQRALDGRLEGGALMDVGCYCVSALRLLAGEPERVRRSGGARGSTRVRRHAAVPRRGPRQFDCAFDVADRDEHEVVGDAGTLVSLDPWHSLEAGGRSSSPGRAEEVDGEAAQPLWRDPPTTPARPARAPAGLGRDDALGQARTIAALYRAASEGGPVPV